MPTHWTYESVGPNDDLQQGDILRPTGELQKVFKGVHPHFADGKYLSFLVITQSCDLVRRGGECHTRYINVAVVRSLEEVIGRLVESVCKSIQPGVYSQKDYNKVDQLLDRIFNQNESKLGLFYLFPDSDVGLGDDAVAFLRVSVAFKSEHYQIMVNARTGCLSPQFENKLGWLVGNLYSRIGTKDWDREILKKRKLPYLDEAENLGIHWVPEERIQQLRKAKIKVEEIPKEQLLNSAILPAQSQKEIAIERIATVLSEVARDLDPNIIKRFKVRLENDQTLSSMFRK